MQNLQSYYYIQLIQNTNILIAVNYSWSSFSKQIRY